jgi:uncharacterized damage-inducible protein DinB
MGTERPRTGAANNRGRKIEEAVMAEGFVHTVHADGRWRNTLEGDEEEPAETFDTKAEAVAAGRAEARRRATEHVIHNEDGTIAERNSYGNDPADRPG